MRYTPKEHPDYVHTVEALQKMQDLADQLNRSKRKAENDEKIMTLSRFHLSLFHLLLMANVIKRSVSGLSMEELTAREFLHEGSLVEAVPSKTSVSVLSFLSSSGFFFYSFVRL